MFNRLCHKTKSGYKLQVTDPTKNLVAEAWMDLASKHTERVCKLNEMEWEYTRQSARETGLWVPNG